MSRSRCDEAQLVGVFFSFARNRARLFSSRIHEILRVFYDRLIDDEDRKWLYEQVIKTSKEVFRENFHQLLGHLDVEKSGTVSEDNLRSLIYCDFGDPKNEQKRYLEVTNLEQLRTVSEQYLEEFNQMSKKPMNLVLFR